jgi:ribosomal protein S18 acetylase RimI-like enzyme
VKDEFSRLNSTLRIAEPADALAVAKVHVKAWQVGYRTLLDDAYLDRLRPEDRAAKYDFTHRDAGKPRTIVAVQGADIQGFATTVPADESDSPDYGELCALYVDPIWWGRGVGRALVSAARAHLVESGFRCAVLWVLSGNVRAERFYRSDQWVRDGVRRKASVWGTTADEVRYMREL